MTKNVPPYVIVGGIPAKIIKSTFPEIVVDKLLQLQWWNLSIKDLKDIKFNNIEEAITQLIKIKGQQCE